MKIPSIVYTIKAIGHQLGQIMGSSPADVTPHLFQRLAVNLPKIDGVICFVIFWGVSPFLFYYISHPFKNVSICCVHGKN